MRYHAEPIGIRARSAQEMADLFADGFPKFITADRQVPRYIGRVRELFGDLELVLLDSNQQLVAAGWAVPIRWNGHPMDLPRGYTDSLARAIAAHDAGEVPDTLVIMAAQVHPARRGQGIAGELLTALRDLAEERGWSRVIAPVRPTLKARYPLTPIDKFARWTTPDGAPLDPWLRTHWRLQAKIIATAPESQTMIGTVGEWETWTDMVFPESGDYVIPDGLSTLRVDYAADEGVYVEPNVWVQHR